MTIEITEEQVSYIKSLDTHKKRKKFLMGVVLGKLAADIIIGESEKIGDYQILCDINKHEIMSREKPKGIELNKQFLRECLDGEISLSLCQDLKTICVKFQDYEFASKFRQKEKDILDTFSREKLYELVQNGDIQISDLVHSENRKIEKLFSKPEGERIDMSKIVDFPIEKVRWVTSEEKEEIDQLYTSNTTTTAPRTFMPSGNHFIDSIGLGLQGLNAIHEAYKNIDTNIDKHKEKIDGQNKELDDMLVGIKNIIKQDELLKFDALDEKRNWTIGEIVDKVVEMSKEKLDESVNSEKKYTKEDMLKIYVNGILDSKDLLVTPDTCNFKFNIYLKTLKNN